MLGLRVLGLQALAAVTGVLVDFLSKYGEGQVSLSPATRLERLLRSESIPFEGIDIDPVSNVIVVHYATEATQAQRDRGAALVSVLDLRPRRLRGLGPLTLEVANLTQNDKFRLLHRLLAQELQANPYLAVDLGINVQGDELVS